MSYSTGQIVKFDTGKYPFDQVVAERINDHLAKKQATPLRDLSLLHTVADRTEIAGIYSAIYDLFLTERFTENYDALCKEIIETKFGGRAAYQRVPSARIQMPGQVSVSYHTDEWYGHGHDVQNFWLPLVRVSGTNSMFVADEPTSLRITDEIRKTRKSIAEINDIAKSVASPLDIGFGDVFHFNSHVLHGSEINATDKTRVSFDFRMLRDGDDRGLKDESFFIRPGERSKRKTTDAKKVGAIYIGKNSGFTDVISQKYQSLLCSRYAVEHQIAAHLAETELSGFDHHPMLWDMITGKNAGTFDQLIVFSALLMPSNAADRKRVVAEMQARNVTLHFVAEDVIVPRERMHEVVEETYRRAAP